MNLDFILNFVPLHSITRESPIWFNRFIYLISNLAKVTLLKSENIVFIFFDECCYPIDEKSWIENRNFFLLFFLCSTNKIDCLHCRILLIENIRTVFVSYMARAVTEYVYSDKMSTMTVVPLVLISVHKCAHLSLRFVIIPGVWCRNSKLLLK